LSVVHPVLTRIDCASLSFFFLLLPHPPRPTLFPYTTLFRSVRAHSTPQQVVKRCQIILQSAEGKSDKAIARQLSINRHTCPIFLDRKSTRLNSSHQIISYAVFCLKKKKIKNNKT